METNTTAGIGDRFMEDTCKDYFQDPSFEETLQPLGLSDRSEYNSPGYQIFRVAGIKVEEKVQGYNDQEATRLLRFGFPINVKGTAVRRKVPPNKKDVSKLDTRPKKGY